MLILMKGYNKFRLELKLGCFEGLPFCFVIHNILQSSCLCTHITILGPVFMKNCWPEMHSQNKKSTNLDF